MNLRTKLIAGYSVVTCFTFLVAAIGIWQTRRLADGLYEVGVVRLPSIHALQTIYEAKTALDASKRELMRGWVDAHLPAAGPVSSAPPLAEDEESDGPGSRLEPMEAAARYPADIRGLWNAVLTEEIRRQEHAWQRAEEAWRIYEAQPRTPEEQRQWRDFTAAWTAWRESYGRVMGALVRARDTGDVAALAEARQENQERLFDVARESRVRLSELIRLSDRIAAEAKETSIASRSDALMVRRVMLVAAAASVLGAIAGGIFISRRIGRSIEPMAAAFDRIAGGDLGTRVPVETRDEIGHMAAAMNKMIHSLETSEAGRARAASQLEDTAERLSLALRTSRLGLWRRNIVTNEAEWDARMFDLFGLPPSPQGPSREAVLALVVPEDRAGVLTRWSMISPVGETSSFRLQIVRPDGQRRHLEVHGIVQTIDGHPGGWTLGVVADITDIFAAAEDAARLRERLSQAHKMESLGALAAGVAHDFNNLLTGIGGFIELAASSLPVKHEATSLLAEARTGANSARDLVKRILTYARDARETRRSNLDLERVVQQALPLVVAALSAQIEITFDGDPHLPLILADPGQIQQVLMNLCTNAAYAIGARPGRIRLAVRRETIATVVPGYPDCRPGSYACLCVEDDGCGMDEATMGRIFEPYFTTRNPEEGTGLGLANVSDIVVAHGGGLTVTSTPGRGTEFRVFFPLPAMASG